jgi:ABC-2 type transport system permease protein
MGRYLKLMRVFLSASISAQLEYRANFIVSLLNALLSSGGAIFALAVLTSDGQPVGGWSAREATVVVGVFTLVQGFIGCVLFPNLNKLAESIRLGTMDFTLLKPIDAQFLVSTRNIDVFRSVDLVIGTALIGWASAGLPAVRPIDVLTGSGLLLAAMVLVYNIWFALTTTAFWFVKVENITEMFNGLLRAGQFPVSAFPAGVRFLFTFIVPIAFVTTVPASGFVGRVDSQTTGLALAIALGSSIAARWFWRRAVASYTSASS